MANFTQLTDSLAIIAALATLPNQDDGLTAAQLKAKFDESGLSIQDFLNNTLIAELEAQGAADKIGVTYGGVLATLQDFIDAVEAAGIGTLPGEGQITNTMMATDVKIGSLASLTTTAKTSVAASINELNTAVGTAQSTATSAASSASTAITNASTAQTTANNAVAKSIFTGAGSLLTSSGSGVPVELVKQSAYQVLQMNSSATGAEWANPSWIKIATTTLGSDSNKVDFTSVPFSTYNLLRITFNGCGSNAGGGAPEIGIRLNDLSSADYDYKYFQQNAGTTISGAIASGASYGKLGGLSTESSFLNKSYCEIFLKSHVYSSTSAAVYAWSVLVGGNVAFPTYGGFTFVKSSTTLNKISILSSDGTSLYRTGTKIELWGANV